MMPDTNETREQVIAALGRIRVGAVPGEYDLHHMIDAALTGAGIGFVHEAVLAPRCRIDFLVDGVGIEVKKGHVSARALREQALRYVRTGKLTSLILVTTGGARLPSQLDGVPVTVFGLNRLWGVSLP